MANVVNGTTYHDDTPAAVVAVLERVRSTGQRIRAHYGNGATGRDHLEEWHVEGMVERSTGPVKVPLIVYNRRAMGGDAMLDHCIVKIRAARGGRVLYQHPQYHTGKVELVPCAYADVPYGVSVDGQSWANFKTEAARARYLSTMGLTA